MWFMKIDLDLYTDYLIGSLGQTSATGLSSLLDKAFGYDSVARSLTQPDPPLCKSVRMICVIAGTTTLRLFFSHFFYGGMPVYSLGSSNQY